MQKSLRQSLGARIGVAAVGVGLLAAAGTGTAFAADEQSIDVSVQIEPSEAIGALALTVAGNATALTEGDATATDRIFTGTLPTVTVTDTRPVGTITDPAVEWYVVGAISDFEGDADQPSILSADAFGWVPAVITASEDVAPGPSVEPGDGGFETGSEELLYNTYTPEDPNGPGAWSANAALTLQTPLDVAPGSYAATITLSLFEDDGTGE
ncbi:MULTISPECIES: hypothetical protein [unclassified Microbacterium]|uniref:hypothetical protein n=1 Tax=unclassified Microbacterium TaxID=2609290 RepID=UPI003746F78A